MKYKIIGLLGLTSLLLTFNLSAQNLSIEGLIIDQADKTPLPGANVIVYNQENLPVRAEFTRADGRFEITNLSPGKYRVKITFVGYKKREVDIELTSPITDMGSITMGGENQVLDQITVVGKVPPTEQKGDTTVYNSNAFKTNPDANAEDLISKMPGVVVQNGQVQAQGENVQQVLVDGKRFFGDDPNLALKNIPAEVIAQIEVFDQASDQSQLTGFDDGQTVKTINIVTKVEKRNGTFGRVYAGYGPENKYQAGGSLNNFNGPSRFSLIGQSNNINLQNFSSEDLVGVSSGGQGRGRGRRGGGSAGNFLVGNQSGISTSHALGLNYSDEWGEKIEISGSYFFNYADNENLQSLNREYFLNTRGNQFYDEQSILNSQNQNHRLNFNFEYDINDKTSIRMRPRLSFQVNQGGELFEAITQSNNERLNQSTSNNNSDLSGYNFSNNLSIRHRFAKRGRTISARIRTGLSDRDGLGNQFSENIFQEEGQDVEEIIDQESESLNKGFNISTRLSYTEPLSRSSQLEFTYNNNYQEEDADQQTQEFDEATQEYSRLNPVLSNVFESQYYTQSLGSGLRIRKRLKGNTTLILSGQINYQWARLESELLFPISGNISRSFNNILPSLFFTIRQRGGKNLRIFYRTSTNAPSVQQLQDVIDNRNPLQLNQGNPNLDQEVQHRVVLRYSAPNPEKARTFFSYLSINKRNNYVGNSTFIAEESSVINEEITLPAGGQLIRSVNLNGYWNMRSYVSLGFPLNFIKSNLNFDATLSYIRTPGLINETLNISDSYSSGIGLVVSSNISENLDFTLSLRPSYTWVNNQISTSLNNNFLSHQTGLKLTWIFWKGFVFRSELNHQLYRGLSDGFNQDFTLWSLNLGKKFLKKQQAEIQVGLFDVLGQNNSISRNVNDAYIEDIQNLVLQRYLMFKFIYTIRAFRPGKANPKLEDRRRKE